MSRARRTVPTGFAGLMAALALVGVGAGYATGAVVGGSPDPTTTTTPSTTAAPNTTEPAPTTTVRPRVGIDCRVLTRFDAPPAVGFVGAPSSTDLTLLQTLAELLEVDRSPITRNLETATSGLTGVFVLPYAAKDKVSFLPPTTKSVVVFYGSSNQPSTQRPPYPAVFLFAGDDSDGLGVGVEALIARIVKDGSKACS